jgi:hypothetical protein
MRQWLKSSGQLLWQQPDKTPYARTCCFWYACVVRSEEDGTMDVGSILNVTGFFLLRVGLPVVLLFTLAVLIDRWERSRRDRGASSFDPTSNDH